MKNRWPVSLRVEDVIALLSTRLFPDMEVLAKGGLPRYRDSGNEIEDEAEDLVLLFETALQASRRRVRLSDGN